MGKAETRVSDEIRLELSKRGCKIFRSQSGLLYTPYRRKNKSRVCRRIRFTWA